MSYILGGHMFTTTRDVTTHASTVLNRAVPGEPLTGSEAAFVADLFAHHPEARRKAGPGVLFFYVGVIPGWDTRNFHVYRSDGSFDNFSVKKCVATLTRKS